MCPVYWAVPTRARIAPVERVAEVAAALVCHGLRRDFAGRYHRRLGRLCRPRADHVVEAVAERVPMERQLAVHFHDTYGQALANILACLETGRGDGGQPRSPGLGGCPYATWRLRQRGQRGSLSTCSNGLGIETGIDLDRLAAAGAYIMFGRTRAHPPSVQSGPCPGRAGGLGLSTALRGREERAMTLASAQTLVSG